MTRPLLREYIRYFLNNGLNATARRRFAADLIRKAHELGYLHWPKHLQRFVKRRDVLDLGCGMGLHGVGFVLSGVRSYTGCDPKLQLDSEIMKNSRTGAAEPCGWTPRQVMTSFPQVRYVPGTLDHLTAGAQWDAVVLHNTTEHLVNIRQTFEALRQRLRKNGVLIFHHHNFFAWNGHHMRPKSISAIDLTDAGQQDVLDWAHLDPKPELRQRLATRLNRIRLDELRALTEVNYVIEDWRETLSNESEGRFRFKDEILRKHPGLTRRDLETQSAYGVARVRPD